MIDYNKIVPKIIDSIMSFSFEFDFEKMKKEMELEEVSNDELEKLGKNKVNQNFSNGVFKIKMPNGIVVDADYIKKQSVLKGIKQSVLFINPDFKYVKWVVKKDFTTEQINSYIERQLTSNSDIDFIEVKKVLLNEEMKSKKVEGFIHGLPIKTRTNISEGKFIIQSNCSKESAIEIIFEQIEELEKKTRATSLHDFSEIKEPHINKFVNILLKFIQELDDDDAINRLIRKLDNGIKNEGEWRDYFRDCFNDYKTENFKVVQEAETRDNFIDLKVENNERIYNIEFKLWYNRDKINIIKQIREYLTNFDKYGFIIMINDNKTKTINNEYEQLVKNSNNNYLNGTWKIIKFKDYEFYRSVHDIIGEKEIYHFILNPYRNVK
jgi:hypothetical protein